MNHSERIDKWYKEGRKKGYYVTKEFKIDDSNDSVDCVWQKDSELIFIEIETGKFNNQIWKNMTKGLHLSPTKVIFDCRYVATAKQIHKRADRINTPIEISLWSNEWLSNKLMDITENDLIKLKKKQERTELQRQLNWKKRNQHILPKKIFFELKGYDFEILKRIYSWGSEGTLSLYSLYPHFKGQFSKRTLTRRLHHLEKLEFIKLQQSVILLIKPFDNMKKKVNELIDFHEGLLTVKNT